MLVIEFQECQEQENRRIVRPLAHGRRGFLYFQREIHIEFIWGKCLV
jgi:hypothetical protein